MCHAKLYLTAMYISFTEVCRVPIWFVISSSDISVLGGMLLRAKVCLVGQVTYTL